MKRFILFILVFVVSSPVVKGQYLEEYRGSYVNITEHVNWTKKKFNKYINAAKQGDAVSQVCIGELCMQDDNYALGTQEELWQMEAYWFGKAAEQGNPIGQFWYGVCYQTGTGVAQNYSQAANLFKKSAMQGEHNAQLYLAEMYEKGQGVPIDYNEALKWYKYSGFNDKDTKRKISELEIKIRQKDELLLAESTKKKEANQSSQTIAQQSPKQTPKSPQKSVSDVDRNIPVNNITNKKMFAVILGNEKYTDEAPVPYAENDAAIFKSYCQKTIGISENHIRYVANAGYNDIRRAINWMMQGLEAYSGEGSAIFYYAGHGIPDEAQKTAYILPVDGLSSDIGSAYSLEKLYQSLGEMPAKSITVFLDACFSGTKRDGGMMASARGVAIKTKVEEPKGKMVVFTAAQGDETAYPYKPQQHGIFTYYLLRKLQETKGDVTLGELADYIIREVKRQSFDENNRSQTPSVNASASISSIWRNLKLK